MTDGSMTGCLAYIPTVGCDELRCDMKLFGSWRSVFSSWLVILLALIAVSMIAADRYAGPPRAVSLVLVYVACLFGIARIADGIAGLVSERPGSVLQILGASIALAIAVLAFVLCWAIS
jgi:hypothetical protein